MELISEIRNPKSVAAIDGFLVLLALAVLLCMPATAMACPGCKEALFDPGQLSQKLSMAKGYALSIGLLLMVPATLIGGITALVIRASKSRK